VVGLKRLGEAYQTGAEIITTACPFCKDQLTEIQDKSVQDNERLPILDIAEIVAGTLTR